MKLIHTGDTHIDTTFYGGRNPKTGVDEEWESNAAAIASSVDAALREGVAAFVHGGDTFKNGRPTSEAVLLHAEVLRPLTEHGIPIVLCGGNHERIGIPPWQRTANELLGEVLSSFPGAEVHVIERQIGSVVTSTGLQVVGLPWLSKTSVLTDLGMTDLTPEAGDQTVANFMIEQLSDLFSGLDVTIPTILTGHATADQVKADVSGSRRSSEMDMAHLFAEPILDVGRLEEFPFRYAGLSHIHARQRVGTRTFYAGSPSRFTFADADRPKSVNLVTLTDDGRTKVEAVPTAARAMTVLDLNSDHVDSHMKSLAAGTIVQVLLEPGQLELESSVRSEIRKAGANLAGIKLFRAPTNPADSEQRAEPVCEQVDPAQALTARVRELFDRRDADRIVTVAAEVFNAGQAA